MKRIFFALAALALTCAGAGAQEPLSHVNLPWDRNAQDLARDLQGRLQRHNQPPSADPAATRKLIEALQGKDQREWSKVMQDNPDLMKAARDLNAQNPDQLQKLAEQMKNQHQSGQPFRGEGWDELLRKIGESMKDLDSPSSMGQRTIRGDTIAPPTPPKSMTDSTQSSLPDMRPPDMTPPGVSPPNRPLRPPEGFSGPDSKGSSELGKSLERWFPKSMRDSPAMKNFLRDMGKKDWSGLENSRFWKEGKGPNVNWDRVGRGMKGTGRFLDRNLPSMGNHRLPDAPNVHAPNLPSGPNLPSVSAPSMSGGLPEAGGAFTALAVIAALALGGFLFWRLLLQPMKQARERVADNGLGPWPVDPSRIRTRDELVKAFDYLALLLLGLPARMWHFRTVATRIGNEETKRQPAENLADAYMQARYAPPAEPLPELQLQQARHDLCTLAGVSAP